MEHDNSNSEYSYHADLLDESRSVKLEIKCRNKSTNPHPWHSKINLKLISEENNLPIKSFEDVLNSVLKKAITGDGINIFDHNGKSISWEWRRENDALRGPKITGNLGDSFLYFLLQNLSVKISASFNSEKNAIFLFNSHTLHRHSEKIINQCYENESWERLKRFDSVSKEFERFYKKEKIQRNFSTKGKERFFEKFLSCWSRPAGIDLIWDLSFTEIFISYEIEFWINGRVRKIRPPYIEFQVKRFLNGRELSDGDYSMLLSKFKKLDQSVRSTLQKCNKYYFGMPIGDGVLDVTFSYSPLSGLSDVSAYGTS